MRIGLALDWGTERTTLDNLLREFLPLIQLAERHGFDSLWLGQHFPTGPDMFHLPSPLLAMAAVAPHTGMALGTGVLLLPLWNPITLAYEAAVLDQLCGGRLVLGMGIGRPRDWTKFGLPREVIGDRWTRCWPRCGRSGLGPTATRARRSPALGRSGRVRSSRMARRSG